MSHEGLTPNTSSKNHSPSNNNNDNSFYVAADDNSGMIVTSHDSNDADKNEETKSILNDDESKSDKDMTNIKESEDNNTSVASLMSSRTDVNINNNIIIHHGTLTAQKTASYTGGVFNVVKKSFTIDDEDHKSSLTDISNRNSGQGSSSLSDCDVVAFKSIDNYSASMDKIAAQEVVSSIRMNQIEQNDNNTAISNDANGDDDNNNAADMNQNDNDNDDAIGPYYKDQVNFIKSSRNNIQYQKSGGVAKFITSTTNNTSNNNKFSTIIAAAITEMDMGISDITESIVEDNLEERNEIIVGVDDQNTRPESISNNEIPSSLRNENIQSSRMTNIPEQEQRQQNHDVDNPVVAEAYIVSSLIIEAKPVRRSNQFIIIFVIIIFVMMIAGIVLGVLCQNGSCKSNTNNENNNNVVPSLAPTSFRSNNDISNNSTSSNVNIDVPSSAPTSKHRPILDYTMLASLVDEYINERVTDQEDNGITMEEFGMIEYWDVTNISDLSYLFATYRNMEMVSFNEDIRHWDVQNATNMQYMFNEAASFNGNLSLWDVSRVRDFTYMFSEAKNFLGIGLENWILSPFVNDISYMFNGAVLFDGNLSSWDVSSIKMMVETFTDAQTFSGIGLENWNTSQLTNTSAMFANAVLFAGDLSRWDVSNIEDMNEMFSSAYSFDSDLSSWNVSNVVNMQYMFLGASAFKGNGLSHWDVSKVEDTSFMFKSATSFNADLSDWNITSVSSMSYMFTGATKFNSDLSRWDVSSAVRMSYMFSGASRLNSDLSRWDISRARDLSGMFRFASNFNSDLSTWDVSHVYSLERMFTGATSFTGNGLSNWNVSNVKNIDYLFADAYQFDADLALWDVSRVTTMQNTFYGASNFTGTGIDQWNVENVEFMTEAFMDAQEFNGNVSLWNVTKVLSMYSLFSGTTSFLGAGLSEWNVRNVESFNWTFHGSSIDVDLSKWDVTSAVDMKFMFANTPNFDSNLSGWNVESVYDFSYMFANAFSFRGIGLESWVLNDNVVEDNIVFCSVTFNGSYLHYGRDVATAVDMKYMFANTPNFDSNLSGWNVEAVLDFSYMFANASSFRGIGLENWVLSENVVLDHMFCGADSFDPKYISSWNITSKNVYC